MSQTNELKARELETIFEDLTSNLPFKIKHFGKFNQSVNIIDSDTAEVIHAYMNDTICGGSGGSGWDTYDKGESKCSSHVQSRKCKECNGKVIFFRNDCPYCGSTDLSPNPRDGRWGISSGAHIKYKGELSEYRLMLVEPIEDDSSCRRFRIRNWKISPDSEHLDNYCKRQNKCKSKGVNFQPLKRDFYLSNPILQLDGILTVRNEDTKMKISFYNPANTLPEDKPEKFKDLVSEEVLSTKKFNKNRGKVSRNAA